MSAKRSKRGWELREESRRKEELGSLDFPAETTRQEEGRVLSACPDAGGVATDASSAVSVSNEFPAGGGEEGIRKAGLASSLPAEGSRQ